MKKIELLLLWVASFGCFYSLLANEQNRALIKQDPLAEETINRYLREVHVNKEELPAFFAEVFSTDFYATRFLPSCFIHFDDFLRFGCENKKPCAFVSTTFSLFTARLGACSWVNPYALLDFLEKLPDRVMPYFSLQSSCEVHEIIKKVLKESLMHNFDELKKDPEKFLDATSAKVEEALQKATNPFGLREMQARLTLFLTVALGKLIWNPHEKIEVWTLLTALAGKLQLLYDMHLIATYDDLNALTWILLYRFGYFIECTGSQIPTSSYKVMQDDLVMRKYLLFTLPEQESSLTTKEAYLQKIILEGLARAEAYEKGIFV